MYVKTLVIHILLHIIKIEQLFTHSSNDKFIMDFKENMMKALLKTLALGLPMAMALVGTAHAGDVSCSSTLGKKRIDGDVVVRGTCTLNGTTVDGNVKVYQGGKLIIKNATIDGDVQADKANSVSITGGAVNGNIQVKQSTTVRVSGVRVDGDIQLFDNRGSVRAERNNVNGNLQCKGNTKKVVGQANRVNGNKEDQCKAL